jgi:hypothetical protein
MALAWRVVSPAAIQRYQAKYTRLTTRIREDATGPEKRRQTKAAAMATSNRRRTRDEWERRRSFEDKRIFRPDLHPYEKPHSRRVHIPLTKIAKRPVGIVIDPFVAGNEALPGMVT